MRKNMRSPAQTRSLVHPELAAQTARMQRRVYTVKKRVHTAYAYSPANATMIEGDDGVIIVDTLPTEEFAKPVAEAFREITDKPIKAVIYTHVHPDHISGVKAFVSEEDVYEGRVEIIAHDDLTGALVRDSGLLAPIMGRRAAFTFGFLLPPGEEGNVGCGLGPINVPGTRTFIAPTRTFRDSLHLEIAGVRVQLLHLPSETDDQIVVWLPDDRVLLSADVIQGETFPNVYTLRGTSFRNPMTWVRAIDRLRGFDAEALVPHHGRPVEGAEAVEDVLIAHRDAIQYLHDQTVRWINKGLTPDEIVEKVTMPPHLAAHPWLGELYGTFKHSIKAIYAGYVGWFEGDPTDLDRLPWTERARRYVSLMGGRERVLAEAHKAIQEEQFQWAAEVVGWLIRADNGDRDARSLKAEALREFAYRQKNANWRNWSLTAALELDGALGPARGLPFGSPDNLKTFTALSILEIMTVRLKAEAALDAHICLSFEITDVGERCALEIRRGICQFHGEPPARCDAKLGFERATLNDIVAGKTTWPQAVRERAVSVDGDGQRAIEFFTYFESPDPAEIRIVLR